MTTTGSDPHDTAMAANAVPAPGAATAANGTDPHPGPPAPAGAVESEGTVSDPATAAALVAAELSSRRRRWPLFLLGLLLGAAGAYLAVRLIDRAADAESAESAETVELATATVEARDLLEEVEWVGTLSAGETVTVASIAGTVTAANPVGTELERGDTLAWIDEQPIVVWYGDRPLWRTMAEGTEGLDVALLETNLVALGYDPDVTVTVDQEFTTNTEAMVERWQEDIGREVTGRVGVDDVVIVAGPSIITQAATVGGGTGGQGLTSGTLATLSTERTGFDVVSSVAGSVTDLLPVGAAVEPGSILYRVDDVPVVAVDAAQAASDPVLATLTSSTFTVLELEEALVAEGHHDGDDLTVDGVVTELTTVAVERWQRSAGLPVTGLAEAGYHLVVPAGLDVEAHLASDALTTRPVLTASSSEVVVDVVVAVSDADEFSPGQAVTIELADETVVEGVVTDIGAVTAAVGQNDPTVTVAIDVIAAGHEPIEGAVTVTTISEAVLQATAVPTRALVSLAEGGFAVEVVDDAGAVRLVGVELGVFDDGHVEVTNGSLRPGDIVVVPR